MSMMNAEVRRAFMEAGVSEETAEAAASSVGDISQLATKVDLNKLESELKADLNKMEGELKAALGEQKVDILKWVFGIMLAQAGLVFALTIKLSPMLLR